MHPGLEENYWQKETAIMDYVVTIAQDLNFVILIHTGPEDGASAANFIDILRRYSNQKFVLAHGYTLDETVRVLRNFPNAFVDTAFMPVVDIVKLIENGFEDRILWGTDSCVIKKQFPQIDLVSSYNKKLKKLQDLTSPTVFDKITFRNSLAVYC